MRLVKHTLLAAAAAIVTVMPATRAAAQSDQAQIREALEGKVAPEQVSDLMRDLGLQSSVETGALFNRVWSTQSTGYYLQNALGDIEGNVVIVSRDDDASPHRVVVEKLDGAQNVQPTGTIWSTSTPYLSGTSSSATDLDGNIYVGGVVPSGSPGMIKVSPEGLIQWQRTYLGVNTNIRQIVVDGEGAVFFATGTAGVPSVTEDPSVYQVNPTTGAIGWVSFLEDEQNVASELSSTRLGFDSNGNMYAAVRNVVDPAKSLVMRLNAGNGAVVWAAERPDISVAQFGNLAIDDDGNVFIFGNSGTSTAVEKISPSGQLLWRRTIAPSAGATFQTFTFGTVDRNGSVALGGYRFFSNGSASNAGYVAKYSTTGTQLWTANITDNQSDTYFSKRDQVVAIEHDRFGNVYTASMHVFGAISVSSRTTKFKGTDGSVVWQDIYATPPGFNQVEAEDLIVDGGSNVYTAFRDSTTGSDSGRVITKCTQPFTGVPTVQSAAGELAFENQGIWAPGAGNLVAEEHLFDFSWNDIGVDIGGTFSVPIAGDFGGGFEFTTTGTLSAGVKAELNGGTCDVHLPFTVEYTIPDMAKLGPGSPVTIEVEYTPDPAARITSCFTPTFNAGLTAGVSYSVYSDAYLVAFSEFLLDVVFVNVPYTQIMEDYIPGMNLLDILSAVGFPVPGEWFHIDIPPKGLFTADFRTPQMFAQGTFNPETNTFSTESKDRFFKFGVSVTEALLRIIGATATFEFTVPEPPQGGGNGDDEEEGSDFEIHGEGSALQLIGKVELGGKQNIDVGVVPMVRYEFSDGIPTQIIPINQNLTFTLPPKPFDGHVDIVPTVLATADFMNKTDIEVIPGLEWKTIEVAASASAFGFDVLSVGPFCFLCFDWDLSEILEALGVPNPTAVNFGMNVFDGSWQIPFAEIPLPCIRVNASTTNLPHLVAASRESMSMIIYDQTSPSPSSFNVSTDGVSRMLLFGERLNSTSVANIEHWGRFEALPTAWINDNTLLVEVPNRFRLLPGVAKVYVTTNFGVSETIDLSVNYPSPRLDAVNPNLWAADPDLATLPIAVIDAKSFAYNDTFIARRDYYIKMRDDLWSDVTDGGFAGGAAEYFPYFDFNQMPGFPAVLWHNTRSDLRGLTFTLTPPSLVTCGANAAHNVTPGLTVEAMVRWQAGGGFINQVLTTDDPRAAGIRWGILNDGRVDFTTLGVQNYLTSVPRVPVDTWTHVAVVFDTGGEANFYINGEDVETVNGSPIIINNANAAVLLGGDSIGNHFVGDMAEVRLWDVMRTPTQIAANFNNSLSGSEPGLIGYWPLNDLSDLGVGAAGVNDVVDLSPISAHGDTVNISNTAPVVFEGEFSADPLPLPRFVQPLDNGIHNVRLAESQYDRPQAVPVVLCNPGPGGGMSNELILTIAAPVPVAQSIEPSGISPVDIPYSENYFDPMDAPVARPIELRITGPAHVPNFIGYEEPKYGNFNADSVVRFNGIDLPTVFTSSSILTAMLPPEMVTLGDHSITVFTPSNGTQYFEELRVDADGNGVPDAVPVFQGLVDSGGESAPLLFRIRYREPVITSISPNRAEVNAVAFDDSQYRPGMAPVYNATLLGADFRDGAIVYFDNQPRDTEFVSAGMLRVKLLMSDVAVAGDFPITVRNPHPDGQISAPKNFEVFVPAMPAAQRARNIARENRKRLEPVLHSGNRP